MIGAFESLLLGIFALAAPAKAASDLSGCLQLGAGRNYGANSFVAGQDACPVPGGATSDTEDAAIAAVDEASYGYDKYSKGALAAAGPALGAGRVRVAGSPEWTVDADSLDAGLSAFFVAASGTLDDLARGLCSFSGETEVLMADGTTTPISEVEVGD